MAELSTLRIILTFAGGLVLGAGLLLQIACREALGADQVLFRPSRRRLGMIVRFLAAIVSFGILAAIAINLIGPEPRHILYDVAFLGGICIAIMLLGRYRRTLSVWIRQQILGHQRM